MHKKLTHRRQAFVLAYAECGNGAAAARKAGYKANSANRQAEYLLSIPDVQEAIRSLSLENMKSSIATAEERQSFWSDTMRNDGVDMKDRLKASELLGKCQGDFIERVQARQEIIIRDESE